MTPVYVIARTAARRPTLQHILTPGETTACGLDVSGWTRAYQRERIGQIACLRCAAASSNRYTYHQEKMQ